MFSVVCSDRQNHPFNLIINTLIKMKFIKNLTKETATLVPELVYSSTFWINIKLKFGWIFA